MAEGQGVRISGIVVHVIRLREAWSMQVRVGRGTEIETEETRRARKFSEGSKKSGRTVGCS